MIAPVTVLGWRQRAACTRTDPELFFGQDGETDHQRDQREKDARLVCAGCPVRGNCLSFAVESGQQHGVWGGADMESANVRRNVRRSVQRSAEKVPA